LLECPRALEAWEAYKRIWKEWEAPEELDITWPFVLLGEPVLEREDDPLGTSPITSVASRTQDSLSTFSGVSFFIISGPRDANDTSVTNTPSKAYSLRPGWPLLRLAWPRGKPLDLAVPPRILVFSLKLS